MRITMLPLLCGLGTLLLASLPASAMIDDSKSWSDWRVTAGAGANWKPDVMGGDYYRAHAVPRLDIEYRDGWFLDLQEGVGKKWQLAPDLTLSSFLAVSEKRNESDKVDRDTTLDGMGDIDRAAQAGLALTYRSGDWQLQAKYRGNVKRQQPGQQLTLGVDYRLFAGLSAVLTLNGALNGGDRHYGQRWFGVSADQAANSAFGAYQAGAGWTQSNLGVTLLVPIDRHWQAVARANYARMLGHTVDSPLVKRHGYGTAAAVMQYTW